MNSPRRLAFRAATALIVLLVVLELVARGFTIGGGDVGLVAPDPTRGWRLTPGHVGEMAEVTVATDSHGVRFAGPNTPTPRAQAGTVVWLLGDSFTFGWGLEWADTVGQQLGTLMPEGSVVYNLGVPGYGLTQSLLRLRQEEALPQPDIVILLSNPMDVVEDTLTTSLVYERPSPQCMTETPCEVDTPGAISWFLWTHSAAYRTARFMLETALHSESSATRGEGLETALSAFQAAAEARGATLIPVLHVPPLWDGFKDMAEGPHAAGWLNITGMLEVAFGDESITLDDRVHWHAEAASTVAGFLRSQIGRHLEIRRGPMGCAGWTCREDEDGLWTRTRTVKNSAGQALTITQRFVPSGPGVMGSNPDDLASAVASIASVYGAPEAAPNEGIPSAFEDFFVNETPPQVVHLDGFWIDLTEVTRAAFTWSRTPNTPTVAEARDFEHAYRGKGQFDQRRGGSWVTPTWPAPPPDSAGTLPVTAVTWKEARAHCQALSLDLPTGAQWERAARGPDGRRYPWGLAEPTCEHANAGYFPKDDMCEKRPLAVGSKPIGASPYGVLDMAGNVWEWVRDCRTDRYDWMQHVEQWAGMPVNPEPPEAAWSDGCASRMLRGGSWAFGYDAYLRPAARAFESGDTMAEWSLGFRCAARDGGR